MPLPTCLVILAIALASSTTSGCAWTQTSAKITANQVAMSREHNEKGKALYIQGRYQEAIVEFEKAYENLDAPEYLFNLARAYDSAKQYEDALRFYRAYLAKGTLPESPQRQAMVQKIAEVEKLIPPATIPPPPSPPERAPPPPVPPDIDQDGVPNEQDECRYTPAGQHPDPRPEFHGCPIRDRDEDTVLDREDACPDQRGAPDPNPKKNGCPGLVEVRYDYITPVAHTAFFAPGKDKLLRKSFPVLLAVVDALIASPQIKKIAIEAHTDGRGNPKKNLDLSERRAINVRRWIVESSDRGRFPTAMEMRGYGGSRPVMFNTTREGRARNNRIEFHIIEMTQ
ncbi:MAG: hypothetical protein EXS55_00840 [Candidatus Magasanikbacteria bacterium]|nr:hypothetical protein [Candidatus Magasanikbacteria bacterium]